MKFNMRTIWIVIACIAGLCGVSADARAADAPPATAPATNPRDPVAVLGKSASEPLNSGFLFIDGEYIESPYVISRRGLDICINDRLVRKGRDWPPYDLRVLQDPGEPPPGSSPFDRTPPGGDSRDMYWQRKTRYITGTSTRENFLERMIELYKRSTEIASVEPDPKSFDTLIVTTKQGRQVHVRMYYNKTFTEPPRADKDFIAEAERGRDYFVNNLRADLAVSLSSEGGELIVGRETIVPFLEAILAAHAGLPSPTLDKMNAIKPGSNTFSNVLDKNKKVSPQLKQRLDELKKNQPPATTQPGAK